MFYNAPSTNPISAPTPAATAAADPGTAIALSLFVLLAIFISSCFVAGLFYIVRFFRDNKMRDQSPRLCAFIGVPKPSEACECTRCDPLSLCKPYCECPDGPGRPRSDKQIDAQVSRKLASTTYGTAPPAPERREDDYDAGGPTQSNTAGEWRKIRMHVQTLEQKIEMNDLAIQKLRGDLNENHDELRTQMRDQADNLHAFIRELAHNIMEGASIEDITADCSPDYVYDSDAEAIGIDERDFITLNTKPSPPPGQPSAYPIPNPNPQPTSRGCAPPVPFKSNKRQQSDKGGDGCNFFPSPVPGSLGVDMGTPMISACAYMVPPERLPPCPKPAESESAGGRLNSSGAYGGLYYPHDNDACFSIRHSRSYAQQDGDDCGEMGMDSSPEEKQSQPEQHSQVNSEPHFPYHRHPPLRHPQVFGNEPEQQGHRNYFRHRTNTHPSLPELPSTPAGTYLGAVDKAEPMGDQRPPRWPGAGAFLTRPYRLPPQWLHPGLPAEHQVPWRRWERPEGGNEDEDWVYVEVQTPQPEFVRPNVEGERATGRSQGAAGQVESDPAERQLQDDGRWRALQEYARRYRNTRDQLERSRDFSRRPIQRPRSFLSRRDIDGIVAVMLLSPFIHESHPHDVDNAIRHTQSSILWSRFMQAPRDPEFLERHWMSKQEIQRNIFLSLRSCDGCGSALNVGFQACRAQANAITLAVWERAGRTPGGILSLLQLAVSHEPGRALLQQHHTPGTWRQFRMDLDTVRITLHPLGSCVFGDIGDPVKDHVSGRRDCIPPWDTNEIVASPERLNERRRGVDDWERVARLQRITNMERDRENRSRKVTKSVKTRRLHRAGERQHREEAAQWRNEYGRFPTAVTNQSDCGEEQIFMMSGGRDGYPASEVGMFEA